MQKDINESGMSELEREFELELEEELEEKEFEEKLEGEKELEEEFEELAELEEEPREELEREEEYGDYADRFYELSLREFEFESEVDDAVNELLAEMEQDFFFRRLARGIKRRAKKLLRKGIKLAKGLPVFQAVKGITQLARGDLKGLLGSLAKAGLGAAISAVPGGAAILPALRGLGFKETDIPEENREAWNNFVNLARDAFGHLVENLNENADDPVVASQLATGAFQAALKKSPIRTTATGRRRRIIRAKKGDIIVVEVF